MLPELALPKRNRDSLVAELVKRGIDTSLPDALMWELGQQDIVIPDMRHTMRFMELLHEARTQPPATPPEGTETTQETGHKRLIRSRQSPPEIDTGVPASIRKHYRDLLPIEQLRAYGNYSDAAYLVTPESDKPLYDRLEAMFTKAKLPPEARPRVVVMNSDLPDIGYFPSCKGVCGPRGTIFISENMFHIMSPSNADAGIYHEILHYKKTPKNFHMLKLRNTLNKLTRNYLARREEYQCDTFGAQNTSAEDTVENLALVTLRHSQIKIFAEQVFALMEKHNIDISHLATRPPRPEENMDLRDFDKLMEHLFGEHPGIVKRFDNAYKTGVPR